MLLGSSQKDDGGTWGPPVPDSGTSGMAGRTYSSSTSSTLSSTDPSHTGTRGSFQLFSELFLLLNLRLRRPEATFFKMESPNLLRLGSEEEENTTLLIHLPFSRKLRAVHFSCVLTGL